MKTAVKRGVSLILAVLCSISFSFSIAASEKTTTEVNIKISTDSGENVTELKMLCSDNDLYIHMNDIPKISRYKIINANKSMICYGLGTKIINFQLDGDNVTMNNQDIKGKYSGAEYKNGYYYLPLSSALPWLDVECEVKDEILCFYNPPVTYYELVEMFKDIPYPYIDEYLKDGVSEFWFLVCVTAVNNLFNIGDIFKCAAFHNSNPEFFNYDNYVDCFLELGSNNSFSTEAAENILSKFETINDMSEVSNNVFGVDLTKLEVGDNLDLLIKNYGMDVNTASKFYDLADMTRAASSIAKGVEFSQYVVDPIVTFASYMNVTANYNETLDLIIENADTNVVKKAAKEVKKSIKKPCKAAAKKLLTLVTEKTFTEFIESATPLKYTKMLEVIVKLVDPKAYKGIKEFSKYIVFGNILLTAKDITKGNYATTEKAQKESLLGMVLAAKSTKSLMDVYGSWDKYTDVSKKTLKKNIKICDEIIFAASVCSVSSEGSLMKANKKDKSLKNWEVKAQEYKYIFVEFIPEIIEIADTEQPLHYKEYIWYKEPSELNLKGEIDFLDNLGVSAYYENDTISLIDYEGNIVYSNVGEYMYYYNEQYCLVIDDIIIDGIDYSETQSEFGGPGTDYYYLYLEDEKQIIGATMVSVPEPVEKLCYGIAELAERNESYDEDMPIWDNFTLSNKYGIIVDNQIVTPFEYDDYLNFDHNGIAALKKDGKWGYFNSKGEQILPCEFEGTEPYPKSETDNPDYYTTYPYSSSYGYIALQKDGKWGYADLNGNMVIDFTFEKALPVHEGLAWVKTEEGWGIIWLEDYDTELSIEEAESIIIEYVNKPHSYKNFNSTPKYLCNDVQFYKTNCYIFDDTENYFGKGKWIVTYDGKVYRY